MIHLPNDRITISTGIKPITISAAVHRFNSRKYGENDASFWQSANQQNCDQNEVSTPANRWKCGSYEVSKSTDQLNCGLNEVSKSANRHKYGQHEVNKSAKRRKYGHNEVSKSNRNTTYVIDDKRYKTRQSQQVQSTRQACDSKRKYSTLEQDIPMLTRELTFFLPNSWEKEKLITSRLEHKPLLMTPKPVANSTEHVAFFKLHTNQKRCANKP